MWCTRGYCSGRQRLDRRKLNYRLNENAYAWCANQRPWGRALLDVLKVQLTPYGLFTPEVQQAWADTFAALAGVM